MPVYPDFNWPEPPANRPWVYINMIVTVDGKSVSGSREEPVSDLGSATDRSTMHLLEEQADAIVIGAGTVRATPRFNLPQHPLRFAVSRSGEVNLSSSFFESDRAYVLIPRAVGTNLPQDRVWLSGDAEIDWPHFLTDLRLNHGVQRLLCEGGSELNAALLRLDLVDEIFVTLAPKIKLGSTVPTLAGGSPLRREEMTNWLLVSHHVVDSEMFLRYRRER